MSSPSSRQPLTLSIISKWKDDALKTVLRGVLNQAQLRGPQWTREGIIARLVEEPVTINWARAEELSGSPNLQELPCPAGVPESEWFADRGAALALRRGQIEVPDALSSPSIPSSPLSIPPEETGEDKTASVGLDGEETLDAGSTVSGKGKAVDRSNVEEVGLQAPLVAVSMRPLSSVIDRANSDQEDAVLPVSPKKPRSFHDLAISTMLKYSFVDSSSGAVATREELEAAWNERSDRVFRGTANIAGFGIDLRSSLKKSEAMQVFVLMEQIELRFVPTTRTFLARTPDIVCSLLKSLLFIEGNLYISVPVRVNGQEFLRPIAAVYATRNLSIDQSQPDIQVPISAPDTHDKIVAGTPFGFSFRIAPSYGNMNLKRERAEVSPSRGDTEVQSAVPQAKLPKIDAPENKSRSATSDAGAHMKHTAPGTKAGASRDKAAATKSTANKSRGGASSSTSKPIPLPRRAAQAASTSSHPAVKVEPQDFDGSGYTELPSEGDDDTGEVSKDAGDTSSDDSGESSEDDEIVDLGGKLKPKDEATLEYMKRWGGFVYDRHPTVIAIRKAEASHESRPVVVLLEWLEIISILQRLALNDDKAPEHVRGKSIPHKVIARFLAHSIDWVSKALQCEALISLRAENKAIDNALNRWAQSATGVNRLRKKLKAVKSGKKVDL